LHNPERFHLKKASRTAVNRPAKVIVQDLTLNHRFEIAEYFFRVQGAAGQIRTAAATTTGVCFYHAHFCCLPLITPQKLMA
jgi:hypothetical protein